MLPEYKNKTMVALKKAHSLMAKVIKMAETDEYCINIMQQNLAAIGLLKSAQQLLMKNHLNSCFKHSMSSKDFEKQQKAIEELLMVSKLNNK